jgi:ribosome biogenesis protein ERB1
MWWAKITDYLNNKSVKLSAGDLEMLRRVREGKFADSSIDPYEPFNYEVESKDFIHPLSSGPEPKRRFVPSKNERLIVSKYVQALKKGWMKTLAQKAQDEKEREEKEDNAWDIWQDDSIVTWKPKKMPKPITAPKRDLPTHAESFNPSDEYLFDDKEKKEWHE